MGSQMIIFAISDLHGAAEKLEMVENRISSADLVVVAGDLTKHHTVDEAMQQLDIISSYNSRIVAVHGNWDNPQVREELQNRDICIHADGKTIDDIGFFGVGGSSPTPMNTPSEYSEKQIATWLKKGFDKIQHTSRKILVTHSPPRGIRDRTFFGMHVGSKAIRDFLESTIIDLCICGHIHEAHGTEQFHHTKVVNTGAIKNGRYCTIYAGTNFTVEHSAIRKHGIKFW